MFQELAEIARTTALTLLISTVGEDELKVVVIPKPKEGVNVALNQPLVLTATPAELDEKFSGILTEYKTARKSLEETLEAAKTVMEAAGKSAQQAASAAAKKSTAPPPAAPATIEAQPTTGKAEIGGEEETGDDEMDLFA